MSSTGGTVWSRHHSHLLVGFQRSAPTLQLGLWPLATTRFFLFSRTIKIEFSYFSRDYYFSCTFSFTSNSTGSICVLQKIEADNHWLAGFQCSAPTLQLGLWPLLVFFCQGTIKIAFSYFSRDNYFFTCTFSFTSNSTGGNVLFSSLQKIEADSHWLTRLLAQCTNSSAGFMTTTRFFFLSRDNKDCVFLFFFLVIIIFLLAHFLLRAIQQVVMFCFLACKKIEADNHWLTRLPTKCTNSSAGFMTTTRIFFVKNNNDCVFLFFSWSLFFYLHIFFYEQFHRW